MFRFYPIWIVVNVYLIIYIYIYFMLGNEQIFINRATECFFFFHFTLRLPHGIFEEDRCRIAGN